MKNKCLAVFLFCIALLGLAQNSFANNEKIWKTPFSKNIELLIHQLEDLYAFQQEKNPMTDKVQEKTIDTIKSLSTTLKEEAEEVWQPLKSEPENFDHLEAYLQAIVHISEDIITILNNELQLYSYDEENKSYPFQYIRTSIRFIKVETLKYSTLLKNIDSLTENKVNVLLPHIMNADKNKKIKELYNEIEGVLRNISSHRNSTLKKYRNAKRLKSAISELYKLISKSPELAEAFANYAFIYKKGIETWRDGSFYSRKKRKKYRKSIKILVDWAILIFSGPVYVPIDYPLNKDTIGEIQDSYTTSHKAK